MDPLLNPAPILMVAHRRPREFMSVFSKVYEGRARNLYVFCDGPRNAEESRAQEKILEICSPLNPRMQIRRNFQSHNLGLRASMLSAIDWFFEQEPEGIILEDDILPGEDFIEFCEFGLNQFRSTHEVLQIGGYNALGWVPSIFYNSRTMLFSPRLDCWGWATWSDRWRSFRTEKNGPPVTPHSKHAPLSLFLELQRGADLAQSGQIDSWAYSWAYFGLNRGGLSVIPKANLVSNIGFGNAATHTKRGRKVRIYPALKQKHFPGIVSSDIGYARILAAMYYLERKMWRLLKRSKKSFAWLFRSLQKRLRP